MTNANKLLENLRTLRQLDDELWRAFKKAEKESELPKLRLLRLFNIRKEIRSTSTIIESIYPFVLAIAILSAALAVIPVASIQGPSFLVYVIALLTVPTLRERFISAYSRHQLRGANFAVKAFGIDNISLNIFKIFEDARSSGNLITKDRIESLIKINKASHEHGDTSYGYAEAARKMLISALYTFPIGANGWISQNKTTTIDGIHRLVDAFVNSTASALLMLALSMLVVVPAVMLAYALLVGDVRSKITRKRYLLILNILKESWKD